MENELKEAREEVTTLKVSADGGVMMAGAHAEEKQEVEKGEEAWLKSAVSDWRASGTGSVKIVRELKKAASPEASKTAYGVETGEAAEEGGVMKGAVEAGAGAEETIDEIEKNEADWLKSAVSDWRSSGAGGGKVKIVREHEGST